MTLNATVAVVGHVEWIDFAVVDHVPAPGEIVHATSNFAEPAGGGTVAAAQSARLAQATHFFTAVGDDELGTICDRQMHEMGFELHAAARAGEPQRRGWTYLDSAGERTITVIGERLGPAASDPLPWKLLDGCDACFVTAGDAEAIRLARKARVLVATPRAMPELLEAGVELDVLVGSGSDGDELAGEESLAGVAGVVVRTEGAGGGSWRSSDGSAGRWAAVPVPGNAVDSYGCGDSFAAALTCALGAGQELPQALALAARAGAACLAGRGPYGAQLTLS
ncbi:MAG: PfkB family carbohydrate kinase [Solirubrobacterales bacterium]